MAGLLLVCSKPRLGAPKFYRAHTASMGTTSVQILTILGCTSQRLDWVPTATTSTNDDDLPPSSVICQSLSITDAWVTSPEDDSTKVIVAQGIVADELSVDFGPISDAVPEISGIFCPRQR